MALVESQLSDTGTRLEIFEEISKVESTEEFRPTTLNRQISTTVIARDNSTIVIGGLIDDSSTRNDTKVPVLGDIPVLGWMFRKRTESNERANLYIFLTPRVIKSPLEAQEILKDKRGKMGTVQEGGIKLYEENQTPLPDKNG